MGGGAATILDGYRKALAVGCCVRKSTVPGGTSQAKASGIVAGSV
jgi:hypothetical protein